MDQFHARCIAAATGRRRNLHGGIPVGGVGSKYRARDEFDGMQTHDPGGFFNVPAAGLAVTCDEVGIAGSDAIKHRSPDRHGDFVLAAVIAISAGHTATRRIGEFDFQPRLTTSATVMSAALGLFLAAVSLSANRAS